MVVFRGGPDVRDADQRVNVGLQSGQPPYQITQHLPNTET